MSVFDCWHFHLPYFASLFGIVHCPFFILIDGANFVGASKPWHDTLYHHKPPYIFLKIATIPTYQGISIAFPRYIAMQHPPSHDLIFMSYMFFLDRGSA